MTGCLQQGKAFGRGMQDGFRRDRLYPADKSHGDARRCTKEQKRGEQSGVHSNKFMV